MKEIDEEFTEDELDEIIAEVPPVSINRFYLKLFRLIPTSRTPLTSMNS